LKAGGGEFCAERKGKREEGTDSMKKRGLAVAVIANEEVDVW